MKKIAVIAVFVVIQSTLFSNVFSGNTLKNDHYENFTLDSGAKHELNDALGIKNINQPIYLVVVTRQLGKLYTKLDYRTSWLTLKNILQDICGDRTNAGASLVKYSSMANYVTNHKTELENSCKIVVFNEHFFYRHPLDETEYANFVGSTGANGLFQLSASCTKTVFYPNFLRARNFSSPADDNYKSKYDETIATTTLDEILSIKTPMEHEGAKNLLINLAKNLLTFNNANFGQPDINDLATDLGIVNFGALQNKTQLEIDSLCDSLQIPRLTVNSSTQYAANLAHCLMNSNAAISKLSTPYSALTSKLKNGVAKEINDAVVLAQALSTNIDKLSNASAGLAQALKIYRNHFLTNSNHYGSSRINTTSLMLPIKAPDSIISNVTYSIYKEKILTQYEKGSYFQEDDANIGFTKSEDIKKSIYSFGTGSNSAINSQLAPDHLKLQKVLLRNISTEICLDLNSGVRHSNGWSNESQCQQSKLHILQSNTIDPIGRTYNSSPNIMHLPKSSNENNICILQADSSSNPPAGSHLFKINSSGAPILHDKERNPSVAELEIVPEEIKITVYKLD